MTFHVGQKVVCVDDSDGKYSARKFLTLNAVYTVRGFCENPWGEIGMLLEEVRPDTPRLSNGQERGFYQHRFRPLVETKAETSFTEGAPKDSKRWDNRVKKRERV